MISACKNIIIFLLLLMQVHFISAQAVKKIYTISADSVKITYCDSAELILENHTQAVKGFLYNTGNGRTVFRRGLLKLGGALYQIGADTLNIGATAWIQGGNSFGALGVLGTLDNNHLGLYTNNTERMRLTNTGKLLIGTTTDNGVNTMQVNGSIYNNYFTNISPSTNTTSGALRLRWGTGDGSYISFYYQGTLSRRGYIASPADNRSLIIEDSIGVAFKNTPRVNIGSEYGFSNAKLSVIKPFGQTLDVFNAGRYTSDSTTNIDFQVKTNGNVMAGGGVDNGYKFQVNGSVFQNGGAFYKKYYTDVSNGNFKIGSGYELYGVPHASSGYTLYISGGLDGSFNAGWDMAFGNNVNRIMELNDSRVTTNKPLYPSGGLIFPAMSSYISSPYTGFKYRSEQGWSWAVVDSASNPKLIVTQYGNVAVSQSLGIGVSSPAAQLHTTGSVRLAGLTNDNTQTRVVVSDASGNLYYRTLTTWAGDDMLRSSLAVNGPIRAKSLTLDVKGAAWPDYVFDSSYRLPDLQEVQDFIKVHRHLPGIVSAEEVEHSGVDVGANQAALLRKIEELTLYAVRQDERLREQEKKFEDRHKEQAVEIDGLKARIAALEKLINAAMIKKQDL